MGNWYSETSADATRLQDGLIVMNVLGFGQFVACNIDDAAGAFKPAMVKRILAARKAAPVDAPEDPDEFMKWLNAP